MYHMTTQENILRLHYDYCKKSYPDKVLFKNIMYEFLINLALRRPPRLDQHCEAARQVEAGAGRRAGGGQGKKGGGEGGKSR